MSTNNVNAPLSLTEKVGYGFGDMASNFYLTFFSVFLLYYFTDVYGIAPAAVALMLLISKIVDAVSDPLMGLIADRTESRWGKYRPYLLWVAVPYGLLGIAIFFGPDLSPTGKLVYAYVTYIAVMLAFTAINVPYSALLAVISPLQSERLKATTFRLAMAAVGGILVTAFARPLVSLLGGGDELLGYRLSMVVFAGLAVALLWVTFATTRERIRLEPQPSRMGRDVADLLGNASWIVLAVTGVVLVTALTTRFASIAFYAKYYLMDDGGFVFWIFDKTALIGSFGLLGQLVGAACTPALTARFEKGRLLAATGVIHALLLLFCYTIPPENFWLIVFVHFLGICTFGVQITLLFAMYTDCAEYNEWQTGKRNSGLVVSASMFSLKFGSAMGGALPGFILAAFGFVANVEQTALSIDGIRLMFNIVPAAFFLLAAVVALFYRIDRATIQRIEVELRERRTAT